MPPESQARPLSVRQVVLLLLGGLVFAVGATYPVAFRLGRNELWGAGPDTYQALWNLWWTREAWTGGERWFFSDWIFHPGGMPLPLHTFAPLKSVLAIPLGVFLGPVDCHAVLMLATYWAAAVAAFLLVYDWLGRVRWAALGALVFALSPYHSVHALGHVNLASIEFFPLYFLCLGRALGGVPAFLGGARADQRRWWAAGAGLAWALTFWVDFQYALFLVLFAPVLALALRRGSSASSVGGPSALRLLAWAALAAAALAAPLAGLVAAELWRHGMPPPAGGSELYSLDLVSVVLPSPFNAVSGSLLAPFLAHFPAWYQSVERVGYLGILPLVLGLLALRAAPVVRPWGWMLLVAWLLSLGPTLRVLGSDTRVPLPGALFAQVPGLDQFRAPARFQVVTTLALALLAPAAAARLCAGLSRAGGALAAGALGLAIACDLAPVPVPLEPVHVPAAIRFLATRPDAEALHVLALEGPIYEWMYWQSLCRKKLVIGKTARNHEEFERAAAQQAEQLSAALQPDERGQYRDAAELRRLYGSAGVGYLVVPLRLVAQARGLGRRHEEMARHFFPQGPAFEDAEHAVYALTQPP